MVKVEPNGIMRMMRGDTFTIPLYIHNGNLDNPEKVIVDENTTIYFALLEPNQPFENAIVRKVYNSQSKKDEDDNILIHFNSIDTENLHCGKYYYMVKLRRVIDDEEEVNTIIKPTLFYIDGHDKPIKKCNWVEVEQNNN